MHSLGDLIHFHAIKSDSDMNSICISPALIPFPSIRLMYLTFYLKPLQVSNRLFKLNLTKMELFLYFLQPCFPLVLPFLLKDISIYLVLR